MYAWALEQEDGKTGSRKFIQQDCFVPWNLPLRYVHKQTEKTKEGEGEAEGEGEGAERKRETVDPLEGLKVDQETHSVTLQRFCHVFRQGELESLFLDVSRESQTHIEILESYFDMSNWCILVRKASSVPVQ